MERLLWNKREAAASLGISVRTIELLIAARELKSVRVGTRRMIPVRELERFARRDHATRPIAREVSASRPDETVSEGNV